MIRINLATKKRSAAVQALDSGGTDGGGGGGLLESLKNFKLGGGGGGSPLNSLPIAKVRMIAVGAIAVGVAYYYFDSQKSEEVAKAQALVATERATQAKLNADLKKSAGYQEKKNQLEKDEKLLRTKIETIKKLTDERDVPPRLLKELAEGTPEMLWLSGVELDEERKMVVLRGKSYDEASVNAMNKQIASNAFFSSSEIKETVTERDSSGTEVFAFTIEARRK